MTQQNNNENFLNGFFITLKESTSRAGDPYSFQRLGIHVDTAIKELQRFKKDSNDKGFVDFTISKQKGNALKYSIQVDRFKPSSEGSAGRQQTVSTPTKSQHLVNNADDLPF